jgi:hypothetical protein
MSTYHPKTFITGSKKAARRVPRPDDLHPFARTTIHTKSSNEERVEHCINSILLTFSGQVAFEHCRDSCSWGCAALSPTGEHVRFVIQLYRLKSGLLVVEWQRRKGHSPVFLNLYKECKCKLTGLAKTSEEAPTLFRSLSEPWSPSLAFDSGSKWNNQHSPIELPRGPQIPSIAEDEFIMSCDSLISWIKEDPHEALPAVGSLSLSLVSFLGSSGESFQMSPHTSSALDSLCDCLCEIAAHSPSLVPYQSSIEVVSAKSILKTLRSDSFFVN